MDPQKRKMDTTKKMDPPTPHQQPVAEEAKGPEEPAPAVSCLVHNVHGREFRTVVRRVFFKVSWCSNADPVFGFFLLITSFSPPPSEKMCGKMLSNRPPISLRRSRRGLATAHSEGAEGPGQRRSARAKEAGSRPPPLVRLRLGGTI